MSLNNNVFHKVWINRHGDIPHYQYWLRRERYQKQLAEGYIRLVENYLSPEDTVRFDKDCKEWRREFDQRLLKKEVLVE